MRHTLFFEIDGFTDFVLYDYSRVFMGCNFQNRDSGTEKHDASFRER